MEEEYKIVYIGDLIDMKISHEQEFINEIESGLVLVDFYAEWCKPCKMLSPLLEEISDENDDVKVIKVNVDDFTRIADFFKIRSLPTLLLFKDGQVLHRISGFYPKSIIEELIKKGK